jgi:hypothetical protein
LPKIEGDVDILLDIYCHRSLKGNEDDSINEEYGNTDRLVELGGRVLDLTLVAHLFYRRPMLLAEQITVRTLPFGVDLLKMLLRIMLERPSLMISSELGSLPGTLNPSFVLHPGLARSLIRRR